MNKTLLENKKTLFKTLFKTCCLLFLGLIISCSASRDSRNFSGYKTTTVSYYANKFDGRKTSSGETYRHSKLTASHKTLPFGTRVEIINIANNKSVVIKVNDRGPLKPSRAFDLSQGAFKKIANLNDGIVKVKYRILK
ncbi:septal ring lytic transglycosylase RlpA family protein [Chryseobacterium sp. SC28]|uniref:septal ring lytic transglycosylase RlpA family protein n=1 Tax=Chryseobacterium sp. SC28 TaxID=2268028 RepID=UPI000F647578|nr:septal ring lytic transglycosylase RlpA family protein [Chryseobacterium sp. SC28]RRQ47217.1 septal ring lytic transglycosylase RlpA family protein [Chryseobacterium sp. SC28]